MNAATRTGAQAIIDGLQQQGVEYVFGYPGGANMPIFDALLDSSLKLILVRHEQGATHMADGYARASGKPGVVFVTSGPGATNAITGIMTAQMESAPLVVICGQTVVGNLGLDAFQEADVSGVSYPVVKHSYLIRDANDTPRIMREAFFLAETGRPGPVLIDMPKDIALAPVTLDSGGEMHLPGYTIPTHGDSDQIATVAQCLHEAKRPLLLVGHGALISDAGKAVRHLAERMQIPVTTTLLGKGAFPETHDLSLGMLGMHGTVYANKAVMNCDLIMSIGSRWDDRIIGKADEFCDGAVKIHIDIDATEFNKLITVDYCIHGDARLVVEELNTMLQPGDTKAWLAEVAKFKRQFPLTFKKKGGLKAQSVLYELDQLVGGDAVFTTDVGQHQMWAAQFCRTTERNHWISSGGAGTMGFGFPAAIGAQLAFPGKTVIAVVGDGGFQRTMAELPTAAVNKLPVKVLIINNSYLGMVRQWQNIFFDNRLSGVKLEGNPDFVKLAEACGGKGLRIKRNADIKRVLQQALDYNDGPCVIDAEVEKEDNVFPMIPSGEPYSSMLLENPRTKMAQPRGST
ncbi:MAG: biosynthetic-type acetolactate synthase large subunit [Lentisphaeria bacterium]|nr:biosynthetic-type acetolactate synthase large subunit [Lentisphaeria bacterium]